MKSTKLLFKNRPLLWALWHPHQKLWNWTLIELINEKLPKSISKYMCRAVIFSDTTFLFFYALIRRISKIGVTKITGRTKISKDVSIIYLDLGTHKKVRNYF